jgi:hypothetical protein
MLYIYIYIYIYGLLIMVQNLIRTPHYRTSLPSQCATTVYDVRLLRQRLEARRRPSIVSTVEADNLLFFIPHYSS